MAHQPVQATEAAEYGVGLPVSGHTHGGQMFPFGLVINLQQPILSGYGEVDGVPVYVTQRRRPLGTHRVGMTRQMVLAWRAR